MVTFDMRPSPRLLVGIPHLSPVGDVASPPPLHSSIAHAPPTARPGSPVYTPTSFDTNIVIITAALLIVLICALGMNTLIKCALSWTRRVAMESQAQEPTMRRSNIGIKKTELKLFPTAVYNEYSADEKTQCSGPYVETQESQCPICLSEFKVGERIRVLPVCNHGFHIKCVDTWLYNHASCPICRGDLSHANVNMQLESTTGSDGAGAGANVLRAPAAAAQVQLQIVFTPAGSVASVSTPTTLYKVITPPACPPAGRDQLTAEGATLQTYPPTQ